VEFALVVPLVLVVLLGAVEIALVARAQLEVGHAAREGAREAAASPDPGRAVAVVHAVLGGEAGGRARVSVSRDHHVGGRAEVVVSVPHRVGAPVFGGWTVHLEGRASMRVER
jgi:Flp pilus assembly protein TadG